MNDTIKTILQNERKKRKQEKSYAEPSSSHTFEKLFCNFELAEMLLNGEFIAIDTETTGLSNSKDRIIEIAAVRFVKGQIADSFSSLVHSKVPISLSASKVNQITDDMLIGAPSERKVLIDFIKYLGPAATGNIYICGHNVNFDAFFILSALNRHKIAASFRYIDTLDLARSMLDLENYKQITVAKHYGINYAIKHRAEEDATVCGTILICLLTEMLNNRSYFQQCREIKKAKRTPSGFGASVCKYIYNILLKNFPDSKYITMVRFKKSGSKISVSLYSNIAEIYTKKQESYFLIQKENLNLIASNAKIEPCTNSKEGPANVRYYFANLDDIDALEQYLCYYYKKGLWCMENIVLADKLIENRFIEILNYEASFDELP